MSRSKTKILAALLICQVGVLAGLYLNSVYPHYWGEEVTLEIEPVDPRSLFRGQYARLAYGIGNIPVDKLNRSERANRSSLRLGEIVYATLTKRGAFHVVESIQLERPEGGLFIRGRVEREQLLSRHNNIALNYGIEAFFATPEKAIEIERHARSRDSVTLAKVMIAPNGKAALVDIVMR
jgi:uncharacterized membrane-anchored protein